jgi:hypothetical protein
MVNEDFNQLSLLDREALYKESSVNQIDKLQTPEQLQFLFGD